MLVCKIINDISLFPFGQIWKSNRKAMNINMNIVYLISLMYRRQRSENCNNISKKYRFVKFFWAETHCKLKCNNIIILGRIFNDTCAAFKIFGYDCLIVSEYFFRLHVVDSRKFVKFKFGMHDNESESSSQLRRFLFAGFLFVFCLRYIMHMKRCI